MGHITKGDVVNTALTTLQNAQDGFSPLGFSEDSCDELDFSAQQDCAAICVSDADSTANEDSVRQNCGKSPRAELASRKQTSTTAHARCMIRFAWPDFPPRLFT